MRYILGIDVGTTALKIGLFDEKCKIIGMRSEEYQIMMPEPGRAEFNPENYWRACKKGIRLLLSSTRISPQSIKAICISSLGETFITLDERGKPLIPAIMEFDNRASEEAEIIKTKFGIETTFNITGQPDIVPTWYATKVLWLKRHKPDIFRKVFKFVLTGDYLVYKLTGKLATEGSLVSCTLLFDIRNGKWWNDMLNFLGISPDKLCALSRSGEIVEKISNKASRETGLSKNTVVVMGALDQAAGMIGASNIEAGIVTETTGTVLSICTILSSPLHDYRKRIPCHYFALPDRYYLLAWCQTAGVVLRWFKDMFCENEIEIAKRKHLDVYDILTQKASKVPAGSEGLVVLPHFMGATCPEFNPKAKGVFFGITLKHTRAHFVRAIMEAVAFMLRKNIEILEELGVKTKEIRSLGGGARSKLWGSIKADVTGKPMVLVNTTESGLMGAAVLAGKSIGIFKSIKDACKDIVKITDVIKPNAENKKAYDKGYETYSKIYDDLKDTF